MKIRRIIKLVILLVFLYIFGRDAPVLAGIIFRDLKFVKENPSLTYEQKMGEKLGENFYFYTLFVKENTPPDAVILIPPQTHPWLKTGNIAYMRYFLYPRKLLNGLEEKDLENKDLTHVLLVSGDYVSQDEWEKSTWPRFKKVLAKRILLKKFPNSENLEAEIIKGDYLPELFKGKWGIIELK